MRVKQARTLKGSFVLKLEDATMKQALACWGYERVEDLIRDLHADGYSEEETKQVGDLFRGRWSPRTVDVLVGYLYPNATRSGTKASHAETIRVMVDNQKAAHEEWSAERRDRRESR